MEGLSIDQFVKNVERTREFLLAEYKKTKFDINEHVEEEKYCLSVTVGGEKFDIAGLGAIGVIAGPIKSRKTAVMSAIEAAGLGKKRILGFDLLIDGDILKNDTEQRKGSFAKVNKQIYKWAGVPAGINPVNYHAYRLRDFYPKERVGIIKEQLEEHKNVSLLVIDGILDLMVNFNDEVKSQEIVEEIMKFAQPHILTLLVMHYGKTGLTLGHLGSALERKLDFLIETKISEDDWRESIVSCKLTRDVPKFPDFTIRQEGGRIYRPDDEVGMWANTESNLIIGSSHQPDDGSDVPF